MENRNEPSSSSSSLAQMAFANYLSNSAFCFYDDETHQPYPNNTKKFRYEKLNPESLDFETSGDISETSEISNWLSQKNIAEIANLRRSTSSRVLAARTSQGKDVVIRIPVSMNKLDHYRIPHPAVLQPFAGAALAYKGGNIEILPFVSMIGVVDTDYEGISSHEIERKEILRSMYRLAGLNLEVGGVKNDLAVLPDGTPVVVDPDILSFLGQSLSLPESIRRQDIILQQYPFMKPVAWIKDGKPAQDKFFGAGYLAGGAPVAAVSQLDGVLRVGEKPALRSPPQG